MRKILFFIFNFIVFVSYAQVHNGHKYVDLGLKSKTLWATGNIGANKPSDYGNHYAWGEIVVKSSYNKMNYFDYYDKTDRWGKYNIKDGSFKINPNAEDAARRHWGGKWCMPKLWQFYELCSDCAWIWTSLNGHNGYKVTGPNGNSIFLPASGEYKDANLILLEKMGFYWSNELDSDEYACVLHFDHTGFGTSVSARQEGCCIRPVIEDNSEETLKLSYLIIGNHLLNVQREQQEQQEKDKLEYEKIMQELERTSRQVKEERTSNSKVSKENSNVASTSTSTTVTNTFPCPTCAGTGNAFVPNPGMPWMMMQTLCPTCKGKGYCTTSMPVGTSVPVVPQGGYNGSNNGGTSTGNTNTGGSQRKNHKCITCNGTGREIRNDAASPNGLGSKYCSECGRTVSVSHYHAPCRACKGKGNW